MTPWATLYPFIETLAVGVPRPLIDQQLFVVAREFCAKTLANRRHVHLPFKVGAGSISAGDNALAYSGLELEAGDVVVVRNAGGSRRNLSARVLSFDAGVAMLDTRAEATVANQVVSAPSYVVPVEDGEKLMEIHALTRRADGVQLKDIPEDVLNDRQPGWRFELAPEPEAWTLDFYRRLYLFRAPDMAGQGITADVVLTVEQGAIGIPDALADEWGHVIAAGAAARLLMMGGSPWANGDVAMIQQQLYRDGLSDAKSVARRGHMRSVRTAAPQSFGGLR
jgi:hypothetical protein